MQYTFLFFDADKIKLVSWGVRERFQGLLRNRPQVRNIDRVTDYFHSVFIPLFV